MQIAPLPSGLKYWGLGDLNCTWFRYKAFLSAQTCRCTTKLKFPRGEKALHSCPLPWTEMSCREMPQSSGYKDQGQIIVMKGIHALASSWCKVATGKHKSMGYGDRNGVFLNNSFLCLSCVKFRRVYYVLWIPQEKKKKKVLKLISFQHPFTEQSSFASNSPQQFLF